MSLQMMRPTAERERFIAFSMTLQRTSISFRSFDFPLDTILIITLAYKSALIDIVTFEPDSLHPFFYIIDSVDSSHVDLENGKGT